MLESKDVIGLNDIVYGNTFACSVENKTNYSEYWIIDKKVMT